MASANQPALPEHCRACSAPLSSQRASEEDVMLGEVAASSLDRGGRAACEDDLVVACAAELLFSSQCGGAVVTLACSSVNQALEFREPL